MADDARYDVLFGQDENLLAGLAFGVRGAIGCTYNFAPGIYLQLIDAFESGDLELARRLQARSVRLVRCLQGYGFLPAAKEIMRMMGLDCGTVRSPLRRLDDAARRELYESIREMHVFARPLDHQLTPS